MDEFQVYFANRKKQDSKDCILYDCIMEKEKF